MARGVVLIEATSGYVLDGFGAWHAFGSAPALAPEPSYHLGWDTARGISASPCNENQLCVAIYTLADPPTGVLGGVQVLQSTTSWTPP